MKKNQILSIGFFAVANLSAFCVQADDTTSANINVTATVSSSCTIGVENIDFNKYDPSSPTPTSATGGAIILTCVKGSAPVVSINNGKNYNGTRQAVRTTTVAGVTENEYLAYELYQPPSVQPETACPGNATGATKWGIEPANVFTTAAATTNLGRRYNICGLMNAGQNVGPGTYNDQVSVTASF